MQPVQALCYRRKILWIPNHAKTERATTVCRRARATLKKLINAGVDKVESQVLLEMLNRGDVEPAMVPGGGSTMWLARKTSDLDWLIETGILVVDLLFELFVERKVAITVYAMLEVRGRFFSLVPGRVN